MTTERQYFMVRAQRSMKEDFDVFFGENVVAVGWSDVDFTQYDTAVELRAAVRTEYYDGSEVAPRMLSKYLNETERFKSIVPGDRILVPYMSSIAIAEALDEELYSPGAYKRDLSNQKRVRYHVENGEIVAIPRNALSEGLQRRLRVPGGTILNLYEFKDEIDALFEQKQFSLSKAIREQEQRAEEQFKKELLERIQRGKTFLQAGGQGLEELVCELMECEGYEAKVLGKRTFREGADADVSAIRSDSFGEHAILAQVKHHSGFSSEFGIEQLKGALEDDRFSGHDGWFITSGMVGDEARKVAENAGIKVMEGPDLVSLILLHVDGLSLTTRNKLGIGSIPMLLE